MAESDEVRAETRKALMERDYDPGHAAMPPDKRIASALEYTAYQMGQINRKLDKLVAAVEVIAKQTWEGDD